MMPQRNGPLQKGNQGEWQGIIGHVVALDQRAQGVASGAFVQDAWRTRPLNTLAVNTAGATLPGNNVLRLLAGIYEVHVHALAYNVMRHKARVYNVTTGAVALWGLSGISIEGVNGDSPIVGRLYVPATQDFRIEHYCQTTNNVNGFGVSSSFAGAPEIYLTAELHKVG
jgi:hypothetical protein